MFLSCSSSSHSDPQEPTYHNVPAWLEMQPVYSNGRTQDPPPWAGPPGVAWEGKQQCRSPEAAVPPENKPPWGWGWELRQEAGTSQSSPTSPFFPVNPKRGDVVYSEVCRVQGRNKRAGKSWGPSTCTANCPAQLRAAACQVWAARHSATLPGSLGCLACAPPIAGSPKPSRLSPLSADGLGIN